MNFYPRPPRGGRLHRDFHLLWRACISIHALREEGDALYAICYSFSFNFYPRPPRGGRRMLAIQLPACAEFLSTPSARRATAGCSVIDGRYEYFYPRPPRGGRHNNTVDLPIDFGISIHALREEGDGLWANLCPWCHQFLSTPSARRATSMAAPRVAAGSDFYPRPPRGGRPGYRYICRSGDKDISIHALREEGDVSGLHSISVWLISIHALREEGDGCADFHGLCVVDFYPRPPRGGRRWVPSSFLSL